MADAPNAPLTPHQLSAKINNCIRIPLPDDSPFLAMKNLWILTCLLAPLKWIQAASLVRHDYRSITDAHHKGTKKYCDAYEMGFKTLDYLFYLNHHCLGKDTRTLEHWLALEMQDSEVDWTGRYIEVELSKHWQQNFEEMWKARIAHCATAAMLDHHHITSSSNQGPKEEQRSFDVAKRRGRGRDLGTDAESFDMRISELLHSFLDDHQ